MIRLTIVKKTNYDSKSAFITLLILIQLFLFQINQNNKVNIIEKVLIYLVGQMKKIFIILLCLGMLLTSSPFVFSEENQFEQLSIILNYSSPIFRQSMNENEIEIIHDDCESSFVQSGYFIVPMDTKTFQFPKGTNINKVEIIPIKTSTVTITEKPPICPQATPLNMQHQVTNLPITDEPKTLQTWYDYRIGTGIEQGKRQVRLTIDIYPNQFNPEDNSLTIADELQINIEYTSAPQTASNDIYDLLILSPEEYSSTLNQLVNHKNQNGILTKQVSLDEIYDETYFSVQGDDDQEKIKYFIKNAIESWEINSVLLVGGAEKMPVRKTHVQVSTSDRETFVSDLYYADIYNKTDGFSSWDTNENGIYAEFNWDGETDEMDLYPDVYLGRLACTDEMELSTSINKIISYENKEVYKEEWFSDIIVIGGDSFPGDDNQVLEGEFVNREVMDIMGGFIPTKLWASNGVLGGTNPSGVSAISNQINEGAGFIDFSGHGNTNVWATHPHEKSSVWLPTPFGGYLSSHINRLENSDKLSIVITGACSVGKFNKDDDCFSWSFVSSEDGGAVASLGSTGLGYAYMGEYVTYGLVEKMAVDMFRAYTNGVTTFGEMWSYGLSRNIKGRMDATEHKTVMEWQAFGDPTLTIATDSKKPDDPTISGPDSGRAEREYTYEATCISPESSELYYVFSWGDDTYSDWLGPYSSGDTVTATHTWEEQDEYEIKVAVKDENGKHSDWSDPLPVSMPLNHKPDLPFLNMVLNWLNEYFSVQYPVLNQILFS